MKILVSGDVRGNFKQLYERVSSIIKKNGEFDMLLCVGEFFSSSSECQEHWEAFVKGRESASIPTFILGPQTSEVAQFYSSLQPDGGELCENIIFLGQRGMYTTSSGLSIAYISGRNEYKEYKSQRGESKITSYFTEQDIDDVERLCKSAEDFVGVDILLTSVWPRDVWQKALPPVAMDVKGVGAQPISRLVHALRPRYHFAGVHNRFYERAPYRNHQVLKEAQRHVTRFIALSNVANPDKKNRYLYAFSITPLSSLDRSDLIRQPAGVTENPYTELVKAQAQASSQASSSLPAQNFFFDPKALAAGRKRQERGDRGPPTKRRPRPVPRGPCWFCLGGEQVEKHLVVSIGEHSYMALPKGGLVPDHVLILPIEHYPAATDLTEEITEEMAKFKGALRQYCKSKGKSCVIFERNFRSQHLQLQVVPVPAAPSDALRQEFIARGKPYNFRMTEVPCDSSISKLASTGENYFMVEFDEGDHLFTKIKGRFPLQFGREVLASPLILDMPQRVDWKNCSATKSEEEQTARAMRKLFAPFDFTEDDD